MKRTGSPEVGHQRLSLRAYARHRRAAGLEGGTLAAVQKAIGTGRIEAEPGGGIDPVKADRAWAERTEPHIFADSPAARRRREARPVSATRDEWTPDPALAEAWRRRLAELRRFDHECAAEARRLPRRAAGSPRAEAFLTAWDWIVAAGIQLHAAIEGPPGGGRRLARSGTT